MHYGLAENELATRPNCYDTVFLGLLCPNSPMGTRTPVTTGATPGHFAVRAQKDRGQTSGVVLLSVHLCSIWA